MNTLATKRYATRACTEMYMAEVWDKCRKCVSHIYTLSIVPPTPSAGALQIFVVRGGGVYTEIHTGSYHTTTQVESEGRAEAICAPDFFKTRNKRVRKWSRRVNLENF